MTITKNNFFDSVSMSASEFNRYNGTNWTQRQVDEYFEASGSPFRVPEQAASDRELAEQHFMRFGDHTSTYSGRPSFFN